MHVYREAVCIEKERARGRKRGKNREKSYFFSGKSEKMNSKFK
jgi:hypothetical protein